MAKVGSFAVVRKVFGVFFGWRAGRAWGGVSDQSVAPMRSQIVAPLLISSGAHPRLCCDTSIPCTVPPLPGSGFGLSLHRWLE